MTTLAPLPAALHEAGYSLGALARVGITTSPTRPGDEALLQSTADGSRASILLRLFGACLPVGEGEARAALPGVSLESLRNAGLLELSGASAKSRWMLVPVDGVVTASDPFPTPGGEFAKDAVLPPAGATMIVSRLTPARRVGLAVDVGVGQGLLAVQAARHAARVIATDINPRALEAARVAAWVNGTPGVELREGSLLGPLSERDGLAGLITSNPPFVLLPEGGAIALSGGGKAPGGGHALLEGLVREVPGRLEEGGYASLMGSWGHASAEGWRDAPATWLERAGCDAWIIRFETRAGPDYAKAWAPAQSDEAAKNLEAAGLAHVTTGAIMVRKRRGSNWVRSETHDPRLLASPAGEQVEQVFACQTYMTQATRDEDLMSARLRTCKSVQWGVNQRAKTWMVAHARGLPMPQPIGAEIAELLPRFDGRHSVREVLEGWTRGRGQGRVDVAAGVRVVRSLLARGVLLPPGAPGA